MRLGILRALDRHRALDSGIKVLGVGIQWLDTLKVMRCVQGLGNNMSCTSTYR
jgi:hypothetical protein